MEVDEEVERTNIFVIMDNPALWKLADNCARLWNEVNFERRQAYIHYKKFPWYPKHLYRKYAPLIGSATAQQIINKNNEAWRSFLKLKKLERLGKLPQYIKRVSILRYWKRSGKRELRIIIRKDCYKIDDEYLYLSKGIRLRYKGRLRWKGEQGRLEIIYDDVDRVWRGFMAVRVEEPPKRGGNKPLHIDLGVINLATIWHEGLKHPIAFSGRALLADWWYWTRRIAREQSRLARINNARTSRGLRKLYRIRKRRFRHAINSMIKMIVEYAYQVGFSKILVGDLKGIRENNHVNNKANSMTHNFCSYKYIIQRLKDKAEEHGIEVEEVNEYKTSSICPRCKSEKVITQDMNQGYAKAVIDQANLIIKGAEYYGGNPLKSRINKIFIASKGRARDVKGNQNIRLISTDKLIVSYNFNGRHGRHSDWIGCDVGFGREYIPLIRYIVNKSLKKKLSYGARILINSRKDIKIHITVPTQIYIEYFRKGYAYGDNIASFDLNSDRISMIILDKHGIILDTKTEWYSEVNRPGYPAKRAWTMRLQALGRLLRHAYECEVGTVLFEDLAKIKRNNNNKSSNRNANRKMTRFPKKKLLEHGILMAMKYGFKVYLVNPGYTSKLAEKLKDALCLDIHTTSAYTLALKYLSPETFRKLMNRDFQRRLQLT